MMSFIASWAFELSRTGCHHRRRRRLQISDNFNIFKPFLVAKRYLEI